MKSQLEEKFSLYPEHVRPLMYDLRALIFSVAEKEEHGQVEESLKWGEPSYRTKKGSPIRIDWKPKSPDQYAMYFNCNTRLIETFKEIFSDVFTFSGNREITFDIKKPLPEKELMQCISIAMQYQKLKYLPMLGA